MNGQYVRILLPILILIIAQLCCIFFVAYPHRCPILLYIFFSSMHASQTNVGIGREDLPRFMPLTMLWCIYASHIQMSQLVVVRPLFWLSPSRIRPFFSNFDDIHPANRLWLSSWASLRGYRRQEVVAASNQLLLLRRDKGEASKRRDMLFSYVESDIVSNISNRQIEHQHSVIEVEGN